MYGNIYGEKSVRMLIALAYSFYMNIFAYKLDMIIWKTLIWTVYMIWIFEIDHQQIY